MTGLAADATTGSHAPSTAGKGAARAAGGSAKPTEKAFRTDIQGLRALAVGAVLIYHLWPNRLTGGFVGVDIFFVISGFLITGHMLREIERTGSVGLGRFWARRAKRLLPASLLVLAVTAVGVWAFTPLSQQPQFFREIIGSVFYVQNWVLAADSVDYLALTNAPSPVQHFWTLSVEEQFYVALPLIFLAVLWVSARRRWNVRNALLLTLTAAFILSLAYSIWLTATTPSVAYFSTATRAWEFALGGMLSFTAIRFGALARQVTGVVGAAMIVVTILLFTGATPFPSYTALLPVVGTVLVIAAGPTSVVGVVSRLAPIQFVGAVSYSVYLWHWPLIVLLPAVTGHPLTTVEKLVIIVASIALAWVTLKLVEDPVRFSPRLLGGARRPRAVALWSIIGMLVVSLIAGLGFANATRVIDERASANDPAQIECFGAMSMDAAADCDPPGEGVIIPDPATVGTVDRNRAECWSSGTDSDVNVCSLGPASGVEKTIFAVGDSHNNGYLDAYEKIAEENNWRIDVAGHNSCYWTTRVQANDNPDQQAGCTAWKTGVTDYLNATDPYDAILEIHSSVGWPAIPIDGESEYDATVNGLREAWATQVERGVPIIALRDQPHQAKGVVQCVEENRAVPNEACAQPRDAALPSPDPVLEAVELTPGATAIDIHDLMCTDDRCLVVIGGALAYSDPGHLTYEFSMSLVPYLSDRISAALD